MTNFLPNAAGSGPTGNGVYKLHAIAHNKADAASVALVTLHLNAAEFEPADDYFAK